jgi:hypothetical protein
MLFRENNNGSQQTRKVKKKEKSISVPNQMASFYSEMNIEEVRAALNAGLNQTRAP